jgi:DNA-binding NtrC family response regulator
MPAILIVEDEAKMRRLLELNLGDDGFTTFAAEDAETGLKLLQQNPVDLVLTDLKLPGMNGLEFLQAVKRQNAALPVVVMTAFGSVETAVEAMKAGASDYVLKPRCGWSFVKNSTSVICGKRTGRCVRRWASATHIPTSWPAVRRCRRYWQRWSEWLRRTQRFC